jgi:predicted nucleotidyltransferase component of viral defense system
MIPKNEVLSIAPERGLLPNVVEKDYVLGWLLMGIAEHPLLCNWVFKGGTCLKKCFFETYRFSEDLDFTVPKGMAYEAEAYHTALLECTEKITEETGIYFPEDGIEVKESFDKLGQKTFLGKISYRGPLMPQARTLPRIKIDLTQHELIAESPEKRPIRHFYSDAPQPTVSILCYSVNEILAEKTRALCERRGRARDLYDVVNIIRNYGEQIELQKASETLRKKFAFKSLPAPSVEGILAAVDFDTLQANWGHQLRHQLLVLPPAESYFEELRSSALRWVEAAPTVERLPSIPLKSGETTIQRVSFPQLQQVELSRRAPGRLTSAFGKLDLIRYGARNRLYVEISYHGVVRLTEPYSLRLPKTGNPLLYVFELLKAGMPTQTTKAYKVDEIQEVTVTEEAFRPRYPVEL